jgi:hypothetical protein
MSQILVNGFNVGTEMSQVVFTSSLGTFLTEEWGHMKDFKADQENTEIICTPVAYGGLRFHRNIYHDFAGSISWTRYNSLLSGTMLLIMNKFQTGGGETYWNISSTITNTAAGTIDLLLFQNCVFGKHNVGSFNGTSEVENSIAFRCQALSISGTGGVVSGGVNPPGSNSVTGVIVPSGP